MKNPVWFTTWGWSYRPVAAPGYLLAVIALLFALQILVGAFITYRSLSVTLFASFPYVVSAATVYQWIASHTAKK